MKFRYLKMPQSISLKGFYKKYSEFSIKTGVQNLVKLVHDTSRKASGFIFNWSKEPAFIMLFFNALASYASHTAQISGLEKSNRENKDFLIDQERKERKIDLFLTIIPPYLLNRYLLDKLDTGAIDTKSNRRKTMFDVPSAIGQKMTEIYHKSRTPFRELVISAYANIVDFANHYVQILPASMNKKKEEFRHYNEKLQEFKIRETTHMFDRSLENTAAVFDNNVLYNKIKPNSPVLQKMRNASAADDMYGHNCGLRILAVLIYLIAASNIIMPYLKSKWTNKEFERTLKIKGETRESLRRKKRFEYTSQAEDESKMIYAPHRKITQAPLPPRAGINPDENLVYKFTRGSGREIALNL